MRDPDFHQIRLHGPWQANVGSGEGGADPPKTFRFQWPGDWPQLLGPDFQGSVKIERGFNRPTGLQPDQPIFLVIEQVDFDGQAILNGHSLGPLHKDRALRLEIANLLSNHNRLSIEIDLFPCEQGQREPKNPFCLSAVRLEIGPSL